MKYELVLFERGETPSDLKATVICAHNAREAVDKFIQSGKSGSAISGGFVIDPGVGRKGREVVVVSVAPDASVGGFEQGETFPSAQAASNALRGGGLKVTYNLVLKQLDALKHRNPEDRIAEIEGIGFQYTDDFFAVNKVD